MAVPIERPFWLDTVDRLPIAAEPLPESADVLIVGAGFTGLSAALALAKRGLHPLVLEAEHVASGASSRNGGMALTGLKRPVQWLIARFGLAHARRLFAASLASVRCVQRIVADYRIDCDFEQRGHVEVACKKAHLKHLRGTAELLDKAFDHQVRILDAQEARAEVASDRYYGALVDDVSAAVNPARLAFGLAAAARAEGARLAEKTAVRSITPGAGGFTVVTSAGPMRAKHVLIATGAYTDAAIPNVRRRLVGVGSYVIATEPLGAGVARSLIPNGRAVFDTNNFLHYYRRTADDRLLFGGRAAFMPESADTVRESAALLRRGMIAVFPQLRDAQVAYAWGGIIDVTFDVLPHTGLLDGLHYAVGYAGHGVAMATYAGERMAAVIAGDESAHDPLGCGPLPAPPPGLTGARPWFLPIAGAWYRLLDWAS